MVTVKICGIRSEGDIEAAHGADALGFMVGTPQSPRNLTLTRARTLMKRVPPWLATVVVTTASDLGQIISVGEALAPAALQVHTPMSPQELAQLRALLPKELRIYGLVPVIGSAQEMIVRGRALAQAGLDGVILDTVVGRRVGGTGRVHDWAASRIVRDALHPLTVILAGGLTPENVRRALDEVRPDIVDVASGVEEADGRKSREKIEAFIYQVRSYESDNANQSQTE